MAFHHISAAVKLFAGAVRYAKYNKDSSAHSRGLECHLPFFKLIGAPVVADRDGLVAAVNPASGATLTMDGALASGGVATLSVPRNITLYGAGDETTKTLLVTGTDEYGETMREQLTGGNNATVSGKKAFKTVTSLVTTGDFGTIEVGVGDVIGLPVRITSKNQVLVMFDGQPDAAVVVVADDTTATATTGDIRGTVDLAGTLNGTKQVSVQILQPDRASKEATFGIAQY